MAANLVVYKIRPSKVADLGLSKAQSEGSNSNSNSTVGDKNSVTYWSADPSNYSAPSNPGVSTLIGQA